METDSGKKLFDFVNMLQQDQKMDSFDNLTDDEKKRYKTSRYMIHRFLSMNPAYAELVNLIQLYPEVPERTHYQFLTKVLPRGKQFNKYVKPGRKKEYANWLVDLVAKHFLVSKYEAEEYLDIYYSKDKKGLRELCEKYGVDKKLLKQAKL